MHKLVVPCVELLLVYLQHCVLLATLHIATRLNVTRFPKTDRIVTITEIHLML